MANPFESIKEEIRILPIDQDRSKKIQSIVSDDIEIYSIENDFDITSGILGSGSFGDIILANIKKTGQSIILKKFKSYSKGQKNISDDLIKEIAFLQFLNKYPQSKAVTLYGVAINSSLSEIYIVIERLEKSLHNIKNSTSQSSDEESNASDEESNASDEESNASDEDSNASDEDSNASDEESNASHEESNASDEESNASDEESNASDEESNASDEESNASDEESNASHRDNLSKELELKKHFPSEQIKIILYKIIKAFYYIHSLGIIHNDIKLLNLMINNTDVRIIDFGLAEFIGIGPTKDLINNYICTEITKAPDSEDQKKYGYIKTNRKSYASDMYSIGCSIVQLATDYKNTKVICLNNSIYLVDKISNMNNDISSFLKHDNVLGPLGYDLLLKIMNPDIHLRWCATEALSHNYFQNITDDIPIDRTILDGGDLQKIYANQQINSRDEYSLNQMEVCFLDIQHQTYMDYIIPMNGLSIPSHGDYFKIIDKIVSIFFKSNLIDGVDTFINNLCFINNNWENIHSKYGTNQQLNMLGILPNHIYHYIFNYSLKDIDYYSEAYGYSFSSKESFDFILQDLMIKNNFKIPIYPISTHVQFIYLKLIYTLDEIKLKSQDIVEAIYINIFLHLFFWFIQPDRYHEELTIWEIIIFCANRTLSLILDINIFELNENPFLPFLTLDDTKLENMNTYFQSRNNNEIINSNPDEYSNIIQIFYSNLYPKSKELLLQKN